MYVTNELHLEFLTRYCESIKFIVTNMKVKSKSFPNRIYRIVITNH